MDELIVDIKATYPTFMLNGLYHKFICENIGNAFKELLESLNPDLKLEMELEEVG
ncbi:MAG: hypothetical protein A4E27_00277 [Methanobacterium sp. PtaU1.Bin242]|nr:MAG: hypothetical protein A4E27_00277 [Methanobacterium sp. PtaU1.Bin242]